MSIRINVDPARLESSANHMDAQSAAYEKGFHSLLQEVDAMGSGWQGKDNLAFVSQIKGFQKDFQQMATLMRQYSEFLKMSAKLYRDTQEDRTAQARRLAN